MNLEKDLDMSKSLSCDMEKGVGNYCDAYDKDSGICLYKISGGCCKFNNAIG